MQTFLSEVAKQINPKQAEVITCVVPSSRAANELKKQFAAKANNTTFLPRIVTFSSFVDSLVNTYVPHKIFLEFALYSAYKACTKDHTSTDFENFQTWGNSLLQDFNEVIRQLQNPQVVFKNLAEFKEIEHWSHSIEEKEQGDLQQKFNRFWEDIPAIFTHFNATLSKNAWATAAMQQADLATNFTSYVKENEQVNFIGFNAISKAEAKIIEHYLNQGGKAFWDSSDLISANPKNEAYKFIGKQKGEQNIIINYQAIADQKELTIHSTSLGLGQVFVATQLIENLSDEELNKTLVILPDENKLQALLNALPNNVKALNITMGLSIENNVYYPTLKNLLQLIQELHSASVSSNTLKNSLSFFDTIAEVKKSKAFAIESPIVNPKDLQAIYSDLPFQFDFLKSISETSDVLAEVKELITLLDFANIKNKSNQKEQIKSALLKALNSLQIIISLLPEKLNAKQVIDLILSAIKQEQTDILGDPGIGLQIMGMLETRALDFERIILLDCNEGAMPPKINDLSLIPFDLKKYFGLSLPEDKQAIYAYYFMRILSRAKTVHFTHNNLSEGVNAGEQSRYLRFLSYFHKNNTTNWLLNKKVWSNPQSKTNESQIATTFTNEQKQFFLETRGSKISASALNTWATCPLDFFNTYILNLREEDKKEIDSALYGTILHDVLEHGYTTILTKNNGVLTTEDFLDIERNCKAIFEQTFKKNTPFISDYTSGDAKLKYELAFEQLIEFLKEDKKRISSLNKAGKTVKIIGLEKKYTTAIGSVTLNGKDFPIDLHGIIDRIEQHDDVIHIIDYKSGKAEKSKLSISQKADLAFSSKIDGKLRQLLSYLVLFDNTKQLKLSAHIISFVKLKSGLLSVNTSKTPVMTFSPSDVETLKAEIVDYIQEIVNTEELVHQGGMFSYCNFCS